jgi:hypothetical protein
LGSATPRANLETVPVVSRWISVNNPCVAERLRMRVLPEIFVPVDFRRDQAAPHGIEDAVV